MADAEALIKDIVDVKKLPAEEVAKIRAEAVLTASRKAIDYSNAERDVSAFWDEIMKQKYGGELDKLEKENSGRLDTPMTHTGNLNDKAISSRELRMENLYRLMSESEHGVLTALNRRSETASESIDPSIHDVLNKYHLKHEDDGSRPEQFEYLRIYSKTPGEYDAVMGAYNAVIRNNRSFFDEIQESMHAITREPISSNGLPYVTPEPQKGQLR